jgi:hypothetical protein
MNVIWIKEWLDQNHGRPYAGQNSSTAAGFLRRAVSAFHANSTYETAVEVQRYNRLMDDYRRTTIKPV